MSSKVNLQEMVKIINSEHGDPHHILGIHPIMVGEEAKAKPKGYTVRAFVPDAAKAFVVTGNATVAMEKLDDAGFFAADFPNAKEVFDYKYKLIAASGAEWESYDPYSFAPVLGELDIHLFAQGTHYEIYEKMGAHPLTINNIEGVHFAVWAPNAKRVSLVGDFNNWDGRRNPMRSMGFSGVWELFVPGLKENEIYKYEIKTQQDYILKKSDPYGNFSEHRPKTASIVTDLNKYTWNDKSWMENRTGVAHKPANIYEVHLGSWRRKGEYGERPLTYREAAVELVEYAKDMGYTHIEILPIAEHPSDESWGYQVTGYYATTSRYGTPQDFMYFVDQCHQNGIGVILDWVPAHFIKDEFALVKFDGTALYEHADPRKGEHLEWGTLIFNYGRNEVSNFLIANAIFWLKKYHIDGLRVDAVASMLYLDYARTEWVPNQYGGRENLEAVEFLRHLNSIVSQQFPGVMMIAEESTAWKDVSRPAEVGGLGFDLKWNMGWMNDFLRYIKEDPINRKYHHSDLTFSMIYAYTENFVLPLSHDEVVHGKGSLINKMPGDYFQKFANLRVTLGFMYAHPGKKLMFMGGEFGQFSEWRESCSLDWHLLEFEAHKKMQHYAKTLNHFYLEHSALWNNDFEVGCFDWIDCTDYNASIVSFIRKNLQTGEYLLFVCNFTPVVHNAYRVGLPEACDFKEILNSDATEFGGSGVVNAEVLKHENTPWNYKDNSLQMRVPPLAICCLKSV